MAEILSVGQNAIDINLLENLERMNSEITVITPVSEAQRET